MRIPVLLTIVVAALLLGAVAGVVWFANNSDPRMLRDVSFSLDRITPNADGKEDATRISYWLNRNATVSIYFVGGDGQTYYFRQDRARSRSVDTPYTVLFSGVVDGFRRPGETYPGAVLARLLPDGTYKWVVSATEESSGQHEEVSGTLVVAEGDPLFPELRKFTASPPAITPNRDGLTDRTAINYYLSKDLYNDVASGKVQVYLIAADGTRYDIPEKETVNKPLQRGEHTYDYAGGVDEGAMPPPDGDYLVHAVAEDAEGQRTEVTTTLGIREGGVPRADLVAPAVGDQVEVSKESVVLGDTLYFTVTVENFGDADIRTTGPWPGACYDLDQNYNTLGFVEEPGAWRVGIDFDTSARNYPFRWAVGRQEDLVTRVVQGEMFYFLPKGRRAQVTGCVRLSYMPEINPLYFWGGLIHQQVEIAEFNNRVDPHLITIGKP